METVIDVKSISMDFGGLRALDEVELHVDKGEIVALIGPNGAGKTTFFNCITGIYNPTEGQVEVKTQDGKVAVVNGMKPNKVTELGLARTFQNIRLFPTMSVIENVMIGTHCRTHSRVVGAVLRGPFTRREEKAVLKKSYELLKLVKLEKWANEQAKNLPYGAQRRLEIARAMATDPFLLLLDEPAAGMNPQETETLKRLIVKIRDEYNLSVLLIEHDMKMVMSLSDRVYVLDYGRMIADGTPKEISENADVIKAYLGEEVDDE